jgi:hypothetical protein
MERSRKLIEYGVRPKPRDTHLTLCDGRDCAREDCETGQAWRVTNRKIIVDGKLRPARAE